MKGIILEQKDHGVYVMDTTGCFHFVEGFVKHSVGSEIEFAVNPSKNSSRQVWSWMSIAACFLLAIGLSVFGFNHFRDPVSFHVAVDINPSVELAVNNQNMVKSATGLNSDGAALLNDVTFDNDYISAIFTIMEKAREAGYDMVNGDGTSCVLISVTANKENTGMGVIADIKNALQSGGFEGVTVMYCSESERQQARVRGVSAGKLKLAEVLSELSQEEISIEELLSRPVQDITRQIAYYETQGKTDSEPGVNTPGNDAAFGNSQAFGDGGAPGSSAAENAGGVAYAGGQQTSAGAVSGNGTVGGSQNDASQNNDSAAVNPGNVSEAGPSQNGQPGSGTIIDGSQSGSAPGEVPGGDVPDEVSENKTPDEEVPGANVPDKAPAGTVPDGNGSSWGSGGGSDSGHSHSHNYTTVASVTDPTCTERGFTVLKCSCGETTKDDYVKALGHDRDGGVVTNPATCEDDGLMTYICANCGDTFTEVVSAFGHNWGDWTVTTEAACEIPGEETRECANDPAHRETKVIEALDHDWDRDTEVYTDPKMGINGFWTQTCSLCGETRIVVDEGSALPAPVGQLSDDEYADYFRIVALWNNISLLSNGKAVLFTTNDAYPDHVAADGYLSFTVTEYKRASINDAYNHVLKSYQSLMDRHNAAVMEYHHISALAPNNPEKYYLGKDSEAAGLYYYELKFAMEEAEKRLVPAN